MLALTSLSPRPSPSPATPPHRRPPPPRGRIRPTSAVATAASDGGGAGDDYHSTIRSLNSHGRRHVPRKSLGQDKHMATLVRDRFGSTEQLKVIEEDITKFHVHSHFLPILDEKSRGTKKYAKVVANLPFNVSTEVVKQILPMGDVFSVMVLMLQDEAALRLANASIQTPEYRPINVFVNFYSEPEYKFKVERANFFPQPTVDGGVIRFKIKDAGEYPPVSSNKSFFSMVNSAFNGKRKMLRKSLQHLYSSVEIETALTNIGLPPTVAQSPGKSMTTPAFKMRMESSYWFARWTMHASEVILFPARGHCNLQIILADSDRLVWEDLFIQQHQHEANFQGNLDYDARQSEVEPPFGKYGRVERVDMKTGFAFVYMEDERDAEDAIRRLDRTDFGRTGRRLRVEWTKEDRSGGRKGNGKRSPSSVKPTKTLFVINFDPINTRTRDLEKHFDLYGKIANIRIRRNFAFVQYETQEDATKALDGTNGSTVMDRVISVEYALRDDDEKRNGYSPDRRGGVIGLLTEGTIVVGRDRSPDRRDNRGRSASPYGRGRERGSPDYGRGRERGSPDYGKGGARDSPDYVRGGSPYGGKGDDRASPKYDRERREASPAYDRRRSRSPAREDRD
ncbi:hypothetical protein ZWY2020_015960 [Hordeum vulgare]|nr:hypothetical protein ZWY2020_015960 [Hordeum vulgare]